MQYVVRENTRLVWCLLRKDAYVCVCVRERERERVRHRGEREREHVCVALD